MINFDVVISDSGPDHIVIRVYGSAPKLGVKPMDLNPFTSRFIGKIGKELEKKGIACDNYATMFWVGDGFDTKRRSSARLIFFNGKDKEAAKAADEEDMEKNLKICKSVVNSVATKLGIAAKYLSVEIDSSII